MYSRERERFCLKRYRDLLLVAASLLLGGLTVLYAKALMVPIAHAAAEQPQTRIETDQTTGAILFIVNGREEARIDKAGLHVQADVNYGGVLTDTGPAGYQQNTGEHHAP